MYMADPEWETVRGKIFDAIPEILKGTGWAPPEDRAGIAVEVVIMVGWVHGDGTDAVSYFRTGTSWSSKGLVRDCYKRMVSADDSDFTADDDEGNV